MSESMPGHFYVSDEIYKKLPKGTPRMVVDGDGRLVTPMDYVKHRILEGWSFRDIRRHQPKIVSEISIQIGYEYVFFGTDDPDRIPPKPIQLAKFDKPWSPWHSSTESLEHTQFIWRCRRVVFGEPKPGDIVVAPWEDIELVKDDAQLRMTRVLSEISTKPKGSSNDQ